MKTISFVLLAGACLTSLVGCAPKSEPAKPAKPNVSAAPVPTANPAPAAMALPVIGPAPAWKLTDLNGAVVTSEQFKGKVVVVDFWATWCGPCRMEIPGYTQLVEKYGKDGLVVVGVSLDDAGVDVVRAFAKKLHMNYPVVMGNDEIQAAFGGMEAIPTTFLIDRAGQVRDKKVGAEPTEDYEKKIVAVLKSST
jgi:thiol-disulfide isomerase/thioredoxin